MHMQYNQEIIKKCADLYINEHKTLAEISRTVEGAPKEATLSRHFKKMGIIINAHPQEFKVDKSKVLLLYKEGTSIQNIVNILGGSSEKTISKLLKTEGILVEGLPKFNNHIFDTIDTEEKAYWLGFLWADGCIMNINIKHPNYAIELGLQVSDIEHLNAFNKFLQYNGNKVRIKKSKKGDKYYDKAVIQISNKHMWNTLYSYGLAPNKSQIVKFPDESIFADKSLIRHFIRGYFDGDGILTKRPKYDYPQVGICGTEEFLKATLKYLPEECRNLKIYPVTGIYIICTACHKGILILDYIYKDCTIYLNRKYERYQYFGRLYEGSYKVLQSKIGEGCDANTEVTNVVKWHLYRNA